MLQLPRYSRRSVQGIRPGPFFAGHRSDSRSSRKESGRPRCQKAAMRTSIQACDRDISFSPKKACPAVLADKPSSAGIATLVGQYRGVHYLDLLSLLKAFNVIPAACEPAGHPVRICQRTLRDLAGQNAVTEDLPRWARPPNPLARPAHACQNYL